MINIMLVAGGNSRNLATFLEQRGTFEVSFIYNDLRSNADILMNQIIKVDKLVYIYRISEETGEAETNIRVDMQTLRDLISKNSFFSAEEILFLCGGSGKEYTKPKKYFTTVMQECNFTNFAIRVLDNDASFSSIYDNLIGVSLTKDFKNTYRPLYRKERGQDSMIAYDKKNDSDLVIEPLSYSNLKNWDSQKELSKSVEQSTPIPDPDNDERNKWFNPNFAGIASDDVLRTGKLTIVSGEKRSGKSMWALELASAAISTDRRVCLYDFTTMQDIAELRDKNSVKLTNIEPLDMMRLQLCREDKLCSMPDRKILSDFLRYLVIQRFKIFNSIILVVEKEDFVKVCSIMRNLSPDCVYLTFAREDDVKNARDLLNCVSSENKILILSSTVSEYSESLMDATDIKESLLASDVKAKVVKPFMFKDFEHTPWLYQRLILEGDTNG